MRGEHAWHPSTGPHILVGLEQADQHAGDINRRAKRLVAASQAEEVRACGALVQLQRQHSSVSASQSANRRVTSAHTLTMVPNRRKRNARDVTSVCAASKQYANDSAMRAPERVTAASTCTEHPAHQNNEADFECKRWTQWPYHIQATALKRDANGLRELAVSEAALKHAVHNRLQPRVNRGRRLPLRR